MVAVVAKVAMPVVATLLLLASHANGQSKADLEAYEGQKTCAFTQRMPEQPRALSFCSRFNDRACCVPGLDADNFELFSTMTDVGLSCRLRGDVRDHPLARIYCINCDPNQPRYVRPIAYTTPDGNDGRDNTLLVCEDWADRQFGDLSRFDKCGLLISSACVGEGNIEIDGRDRYVCGDDVVIPTNEKNDSLSDIQNVELFLNFPSLGTPEMDGDYGFKLVRNEACTNAEAREENPDCLMTAQQLEARRGDFASVPPDDTVCDDDDYYRDHPDECVPLIAEMCFSGSSASSVMFSAGLASIIVALATTLLM